MDGGRTGVAWRLALVAVAVVALVVPGRILASQHAEDDALTPYGGRRARRRDAVPARPCRSTPACWPTTAAAVELVEVRPRIAFDTTVGGHHDPSSAPRRPRAEFAVAHGPDGAGLQRAGRRDGCPRPAAARRPAGGRVGDAPAHRPAGGRRVRRHLRRDASRRATEHAGRGLPAARRLTVGGLRSRAPTRAASAARSSSSRDATWWCAMPVGHGRQARHRHREAAGGPRRGGTGGGVLQRDAVAGSTPRVRAASRYGSGYGLVRATSSPDTVTGRCSRPIASSTASTTIAQRRRHQRRGARPPR